nr:MAG TPA: protein of unknown function (DUF4376) [Caudoviricetes sp.]
MRTNYYGNESITDNSTLEEAQAFRQEENKGALSRFLENSTVEFNGKQYGVTEADQNEMQAMVMQYQMLTQAGVKTELQWHAKHEECHTFTIDEMVALVAAVKAFVLPHMNKMQSIKQNIYNAKSVEEVRKIEVFTA